MTVAARFAKLLAASVDPQDYHAIAMAAEQRVRTLNDCIMEVAEGSLSKEDFGALKAQAEEREAQAIKSVEERQNDHVPPIKTAESPEPTPPSFITHVQARVAERYSLDVTQGDIKEIEDLIRAKSPGAKLIKQTAVISLHYEVQMKGKRVSVIYNPKKSCVVTALPLKPHQKAGTKRWERGGPREGAWRLEDEEMT